MGEFEIIDKAVKKLQELTGIEVEFRPPGEYKKFDEGIIRIGPGIELAVEVKNEIRQPQLPPIFERARHYTRPFIIISRYIPMPIKNQLKSEGVNYLETAGNCFIHHKKLFIYINDQKVTPEREVDKSKLWNAAGVRFVFAILNNPELLNQPYRIMADNAKVALGTVGRLLEDLQKENFIKRGNRDDQKIFFLDRKEELISKWTTMYNTVLRPKLFIGKFKPTGGSILDDMVLPPGILWGGEMAGAKLTKYLNPEKQALYISIPKAEVMKYLKIVPDADGKIELLNIFWNKELVTNSEFADDQIAPPIIVYADLLSSHDSRNYETAERIKEKIYGT